MSLLERKAKLWIHYLRTVDDFVGLLGTAGLKHDDHRRRVLGVSEDLRLGLQRDDAGVLSRALHHVSALSSCLSTLVAHS